LHSSDIGDKIGLQFIVFKKVYDSVGRKVLYSIVIEFGVPMKLVIPIKICLNEMYSKVCIGKQFSDNFHIQKDLKEGCFIASAFHLCSRICHKEGPGKIL
jgi:hypothetical protein